MLHRIRYKLLCSICDCSPSSTTCPHRFTDACWTKLTSYRDSVQIITMPNGHHHGIVIDPQASARASRLTFLLDKSTIYAKIIGDRMARQQIAKQKAEQRAATRKENKGKKADHANTRGGLREHKKDQDEEPQPTNGKRRRRGDAGRDEKRAKTEDANVSDRPIIDAAFLLTSAGGETKWGRWRRRRWRGRPGPQHGRRRQARKRSGRRGFG